MKFSLLIAATAAAAISASSAVAAPAAPQTAVRHDDLDLATAQDAKVMLHRIKAAAARVCLDSPGSNGNDFASIERLEMCRMQSVARAVAALGAPRVAEVYAAKAPQQVLAQLP